jgi:hypothetical protein
VYIAASKPVQEGEEAVEKVLLFQCTDNAPYLLNYVDIAHLQILHIFYGTGSFFVARSFKAQTAKLAP